MAENKPSKNTLEDAIDPSVFDNDLREFDPADFRTMYQNPDHVDDVGRELRKRFEEAGGTVRPRTKYDPPEFEGGEPEETETEETETEDSFMPRRKR